MSDPRFARIKTDPRFRRPRKHATKVVVDPRFKDIFAKPKKKNRKETRVDKYGRPLPATYEQDNLRRFYRLESEDRNEATSQPDYARGEILLQSSDDEDEGVVAKGGDSDTGMIVTIGPDNDEPFEDESEIDLDETQLADLEAQAAEYAKSYPEPEVKDGAQTNRLAVVNLDWDHLRAIHLFKIFSSLVSPTASAVATTNTSGSGIQTRRSLANPVVRGRVLSVRVYPSAFGKERLAKEEKEGPPPEIFKKPGSEDEEVNERTIYDVGFEEQYNEDAVRKYQLERLRYYYAIVTCDSVNAAVHIYKELDGTELERSANVFDLSFVPGDMTFDDDFRDEATEDVASYQGVDYVTDALRHSKVRLTWDDDDPERTRVTRRALSRREIEEADFEAYLASSTSESESDGEKFGRVPGDKSTSRDGLRALLLGGNELPEGWGEEDDKDLDMVITFTPGLSGQKGGEETTLDRYRRKIWEKRKKRKEEIKERAAKKSQQDAHTPTDEFFEAGSEGEEAGSSSLDKQQKKTRTGKHKVSSEAAPRTISAQEELALLVASDDPSVEPKHFNMKSVLKAEKRKRKSIRGQDAEEDNELQENFTIDVKDERFKALHEDHAFAIDPSNPRFKKTKSMAALLEERSKLQTKEAKSIGDDRPVHMSGEGKSLKNLVESIKRKSQVTDALRLGKRQKP